MELQIWTLKIANIIEALCCVAVRFDDWELHLDLF